MPLTRVTSQLISIPSNYPLTGSLSGTASYAITASYAANAGSGGGTTLTTGSTYSITSSWATTSSNIIGGTSNYIPLWSTNTSLGNSVLYQSSSNIGIGTTSPNAKLHLSSTGGISAPILRISGTATDTYNWASAVLYSNLTSSATTVHLIGKSETNYNSAYFGYKHSSDGSVNNAISFGFYAANDLVNILANGNVGIGTTSPGYKLDVVGAVKSTIDSNFSFVSNRSGTTVWCGLGFLTNNVNKWFVGLRETSDDNLRWYNFTNSTERMVLTETGNLGIGTSTPASILHLQSSAATTLLRIDNTNNSNDAAILLTDSTNPTGEGFRITYDSSVGDTYFNNIYTSSIQAFNFQKGDFGSGTSLLTILNSGNVGIGTTSPAYKLDVNGSASFADNVIITKNQNALTRLIVSNTTSNSNSYVETAFVNDVSSGAGAVGRYGSTTTTYKIVTSNNQYLYNGPTAGDIAILNDFASGSIKMSAGGNSNVQFIISSSGNVGIGTTSPSAKLHVNGNISASAFTGSVFGTSSWANNATTASFSLNGGGGGTTLTTGSTYPITSSWATNSITASYAANAGSGGSGGGSTSLTGITFPYVSGSNVYTLSQSAVAANDLLLSVNGVVQTPTTDYTVSASSVTFTDSYPSGSSVNVRYLVTATSSSFVDLNNIVLTGTTTGDAYYPQVAALLHFDGVNGSTTITDNSKNNLTVTVVGNAQISTAQSKFGGSSLYLDGTGDRLTIASPTPDFSFGTGDFTIETWVYKTVASQAAVLDARVTADTVPWTLTINSSNFPYFYDGTQYVSTVSITLNSWVHLAVVRTSGVLKIFVNGIQGYSAAHSVNLNRTAGLIIGDTVGLTSAYAGYIDELRITNGYARYTGNFTPSTTAFSNTGGDVGKALVVNSTATGVSIGTAGYLSSQLAKAWVNFNGTGTVAIRDSYNVSSITDNATGQYYVNFSTPMNNTNYAVVGCSATSISNFDFTGTGPDTVNRCFIGIYGTAFSDKPYVQALVFSN